MAWLDIKKAYDAVPHDWILYCLRLFGVYDKIIKFVECAMCQWTTMLTVNGAQVDISCGIFQGDSLSPLLFVMSLAPLSVILYGTSKVTSFQVHLQ